MTEQEWLECADPKEMLEFLRGAASERKFRLLACACCRGKQYNIFPQGLVAVSVAEALADGQAQEAERAATERLVQSLIPDDGSWSKYSLISWSLHLPKGGSYPLEYVMPFVIPSVIEAGLASDGDVQYILHDLIGPLLFRSVTVSPSWQTATVVGLATAIYEERAFDRMPVLGDALEDAGCDNADILKHCRQPGEHVRGCWCVDLVLGKS